MSFNHGGHKHDHHHTHGPLEPRSLSAFKWAFLLNLSFALIELVGGILVNSMAIVSDAIHDFGDAIAVGLAFFLEKKSRGHSDGDYSYGYRRLSLFSAVLTSLILFIGACFILLKSIPRLFEPQMPQMPGMLALAILGVSVNGLAYWKLSRAGPSMNQRALSLHFIEDIFGWIIVLVGAVVMWFYPLAIIDPLLAILLSTWVSWNALKNLRSSIRVFLQATPSADSIGLIKKALLAWPEVCGVHHVHIWSLDGEKHIFTAHVSLKNNKPLSETIEFKESIKSMLREKFNISEATLELEWEKDICSDPHHH